MAQQHAALLCQRTCGGDDIDITGLSFDAKQIGPFGPAPYRCDRLSRDLQLTNRIGLIERVKIEAAAARERSRLLQAYARNERIGTPAHQPPIVFVAAIVR